MTSNHISSNVIIDELHITTPSPIKDELNQPTMKENWQETAAVEIERPPSDDSTINKTIVVVEKEEEEEEVILFDLSSKLSGITSLDEIGMMGTGSTPKGMNVGMDGQLLLSYLSTRGTVGDQIKAYENFIQNQIPIIIGQNIISLGDGTHCAFTNSHVVSPYLPGFTDGPKVLFPNIARRRGLTYAIDLKVDIERRRDKTGEVVVVDNNPQVVRGIYV